VPDLLQIHCNAGGDTAGATACPVAILHRCRGPGAGPANSAARRPQAVSRCNVRRAGGVALSRRFLQSRGPHCANRLLRAEGAWQMRGAVEAAVARCGSNLLGWRRKPAVDQRPACRALDSRVGDAAVRRAAIKPCGHGCQDPALGLAAFLGVGSSRSVLEQLRGRFGADVPLRSLGRPLPLARRRSKRHLHAHYGNCIRTQNRDEMALFKPWRNR
jgi:hypothetical protein